jgi:hypothetical protein
VQSLPGPELSPKPSTSSLVLPTVIANQAMSSPTGQSFSHQTCAKEGQLQYETTCVKGGQATFTLAASEALLVYL